MRGGEWCEYEGAVFWWKRCEVPACENFICMGKSDKSCWPHLMSGGAPVTKRRVSPFRRKVVNGQNLG